MTTRPIRLHVDFPSRGRGESENPNSAIARPFRRLLERGITPGRLSYIVIDPCVGGVRLFGTICETPGRRVLFYPACNGRALRGHFSRDPQRRHLQPSGVVDHFTFQLKERTAHVTEVSEDSSRRLIVGRRHACREVAPGLFAWFGLTVASVRRFEVLPERLYMSAEWPAPDVDRRLALFRTPSQVLMLPVREPPNECFAQVNGFVDLEPRRPLARITTFLPNGPPELVERVAGKQTVQDVLYSFDAFGGAYAVRMDVLVADGRPISQVGFGY
jgi:hypothetical protein